MAQAERMEAGLDTSTESELSLPHHCLDTAGSSLTHHCQEVMERVTAQAFTAEEEAERLERIQERVTAQAVERAREEMNCWSQEIIAEAVRIQTQVREEMSAEVAKAVEQHLATSGFTRQVECAATGTDDTANENAAEEVRVLGEALRQIGDDVAALARSIADVGVSLVKAQETERHFASEIENLWIGVQELRAQQSCTSTKLAQQEQMQLEITGGQAPQQLCVQLEQLDNEVNQCRAERDHLGEVVARLENEVATVVTKNIELNVDINTKNVSVHQEIDILSGKVQELQARGAGSSVVTRSFHEQLEAARSQDVMLNKEYGDRLATVESRLRAAEERLVESRMRAATPVGSAPAGICGGAGPSPNGSRSRSPTSQRHLPGVVMTDAVATEIAAAIEQRLGERVCQAEKSAFSAFSTASNVAEVLKKQELTRQSYVDVAMVQGLGEAVSKLRGDVARCEQGCLERTAEQQEEVRCVGMGLEKIMRRMESWEAQRCEVVQRMEASADQDGAGAEHHPDGLSIQDLEPSGIQKEPLVFSLTSGVSLQNSPGGIDDMLPTKCLASLLSKAEEDEDTQTAVMRTISIQESMLDSERLRVCNSRLQSPPRRASCPPLPSSCAAAHSPPAVPDAGTQPSISMDAHAVNPGIWTPVCYQSTECLSQKSATVQSSAGPSVTATSCTSLVESSSQGGSESSSSIGSPAPAALSAGHSAKIVGPPRVSRLSSTALLQSLAERAAGPKLPLAGNGGAATLLTARESRASTPQWSYRHGSAAPGRPGPGGLDMRPGFAWQHSPRASCKSASPIRRRCECYVPVAAQGGTNGVVEAQCVRKVAPATAGTAAAAVVTLGGHGRWPSPPPAQVLFRPVAAHLP